MDLPLHILWLAAVPGLILGSYAVTAGLRLARGEGASLGRSRCDACAAPLGFAETAPVVSYLALRGACRRCGAGIDATHLAGEVAGAVVVVSAVWAAEPLRAAPLAVLGLVLICAAAVDVRVRRLPDPLTFATAVLAALLAAEAGWPRLVEGAVAAAVTIGVLLAVRALARRRGGRDGLGLGDVKLMAALALWVGAATPWMAAAAAVLGLAAAPWARDAEGRIAFGPMIAAAGWGLGLGLETGLIPWA